MGDVKQLCAHANYFSSWIFLLTKLADRQTQIESSTIEWSMKQKSAAYRINDERMLEMMDF